MSWLDLWRYPRARTYATAPLGQPGDPVIITRVITMGRSRGETIPWCRICEAYIVAGRCCCPAAVREKVEQFGMQQRAAALGIELPDTLFNSASSSPREIITIGFDSDAPHQGDALNRCA